MQTHFQNLIGDITSFEKYNIVDMNVINVLTGRVGIPEGMIVRLEAQLSTFEDTVADNFEHCS